MAKRMVPKNDFLLKKIHNVEKVSFVASIIDNAGITQKTCFMYVNGFVLEACNICTAS